MSKSFSLNLIDFMNLSNSLTDFSHKSEIFIFSTVTPRAAWERRLPLHSSHGISFINDSISCLIQLLPVSRNLLSRLGIMPSKEFLYLDSP